MARCIASLCSTVAAAPARHQLCTACAMTSSLPFVPTAYLDADACACQWARDARCVRAARARAGAARARLVAVDDERHVAEDLLGGQRAR